MSDIAVGAEASKPLSQWERVLDTFIAPSKTFTDILRDSSWWLPWLLGVLVTLSFGVAVQQKIGWDKTYTTSIGRYPNMRWADANNGWDHGYIHDAQAVDDNHMGGPHEGGSPPVRFFTCTVDTSVASVTA